MHIFIFPSKDTYVTNFTNFENKNFGIDELLNISSVASSVKSVVKYQSGSLDSDNYIINNVVNFSGSLVGYFTGSTTNVIALDTPNEISVVYGTVVAYANPTASCANFTTTRFTGTVTGSVSGHVASALLNGNTYTDETVSILFASGSVTDFSGDISGSSISGNISGSLTGIVTNLSGSLYGISGNMEGDIYGSYIYYNPMFSFNTYSKFSRALIKFDVSEVSSSIASGDISDPKFVLNMKVLQQKELPLTYTLYAYPISQSWEMGNGRFADNGSTTGASWNYRDYSSTGGTRWYPSNPTKDLYDYLTNESNKSIAFGNGGGTWYYSVPNSATVPTSSFCSTLYTGSSLIMSQSFGYESSDIKMDVTPDRKSVV